MKAKPAETARALDNPSEAVRLFLLYGPDQAGSEALAARLGKALGDEAERVDLTGAELRGDPARLADEAASLSLFGTQRYIRVEASGDDVFAAVEGLLEAERAGNPVVVIAGALRATSKLVKLANGHAGAIACPSYVPEGPEADRMVISMGQEIGVQITPDCARRLAGACGGNRAILASELEKLSLYLDAAPDRPRKLDEAALDAAGADSEEGDLGKLANLVLSGDLPELDEEIRLFAARGHNEVAIVRVLMRKLMTLAKLRAEVDRGNSAQSTIAKAGRAIFWKEKQMVTRQLQMWKSPALATAIERTARAERTLKSSGGPGAIGAVDELFAIARHARRMR